MTTLTHRLTIAEAFGRAIHGAGDRAARRVTDVVHMRTERMPPIDADPVTQRIAAERVTLIGLEHPLDQPAQTIKGWRGRGGTIVLTSHLELQRYPDEYFVVDDIELHAEPEVIDAVRELQETCATLQQRVWELEDGDR